MARPLSINERVMAKEQYFDLVALLHMDQEYYTTYIQPHMFYMPATDLWRWKMNVARAMGNSMNREYVQELIKAYEENSDEMVRGMIAWALGVLGGTQAKTACEKWRKDATGIVKEEVDWALEHMQ